MLLKAKIQAYEGGHTPSYEMKNIHLCILLILVDLGYGCRIFNRNFRRVV